MMKKRLVQRCFVCTMLLVVMLVVAGCGKGSEEASSDGTVATGTPTPEAVVEKKEEIAATGTPAPEVVVDKKEDPVITATPVPEVLVEEQEEPFVDESIIVLVDKEDKIGRGRYDGKDQSSAYKINDKNLPYYVGRNDGNATNYLKNNQGADDGCLYLGMPMYLPDNVLYGVTSVSIGDTDVAKIENNELVGLKQGDFLLTCYDEEMNVVSEKKYFVTTFNDSKDNKASLLTLKGNLSDYADARDFEYWKTSVKTIQDMCWMLEARNFVYDFNKEPEFGYIWNSGRAEDVWTWTADAKTIFEMSGGVCIQVAQLATAMLADDFEDWGAVLVEGNQGHIFNWFYEDGVYYVFDFTQVISENWEYMNEIQFRDYSKYVVKCNSIEEVKEYCLNGKVDLNLNYAVYMYSCKGHDFLPCNVNTGMSDSNACLNGTFRDGDKEYITIRFQDIVMEDLVVFYENPNASVIVWESVPLDMVGADVPYVYGREEIVFRYNY